MSELPENWVETTLGEIARWGSGGTPNRNISEYYGGKIPWFKTGELNEGIVTEAEEYLTDEGLKNSSAKIFPKGSVIIAMYGATIGKCAILGVDGSTNQACAVAQPKKEIEALYLFHYLRSQKQNFIDKGKGGAQPNISQTVIKEHPIPLAPLSEQKLIVAKLNTLFKHLDQLQGRLHNIPTILKQFRQAVLTQAVTGKLTEKWREENSAQPDFNFDQSLSYRSDKIFKITNEWGFSAFRAVAEIKANLVDPMKYLELPLIAPDNIESKTGKLISKPTVEEIMPISPKHHFHPGMIVYSKIRPYLSKAIMADFSGLCSADMYPIVGRIDTKYLFYYMLSNEYLGFATTAGERTVLPKINQKELSIIPVPVPPTFKEQKEIVRRIESLFAVANRIEASHATLQEKINHLPQGILSKAFRGELIRNDI